MHTLVLAFVFITIYTGKIRGHENYESYYKKGVEAYLEEDYPSCIDNFNKARQEYKNTQNQLIICRSKCSYQANDDPPISNIIFTNELKFYEQLIRKTLCLVKCRKQAFRDKGEVWDTDLMAKFESYNPFEYLHICYYHKGDYQNAASSAFTFLSANTDNKAMVKNLEYYLTLPGIDANLLTNFELKPFTRLYIEGNEAYNSEEFGKVVNYFEESLESYLLEEENCRTLCEGAYSQEWFAEFTITVTNHFTSILRCKQMCAHKLSMINGEHYHDLIPSYFHYLQFAHYKLGKLAKACQAVATYLLFFPEDQTMNFNKNYYLTEGAKPENFIPDPEIKLYFDRDIQEKTILKYIDENFKFGDEDKEEDICPLKDSPKNKDNLEVQGNTNLSDEQLKKKELQRRAIFQMRNIANIKLVKGEKDLNGTQRFLASGFITPRQCQILMKMAKIFALDGDGYKSTTSPHTDKETFSGVSIGKMALLVHHGYLELQSLDVFFDVTEKARDYLERYFNLREELYFSYSQLVCREAISEDKTRLDMSHEIHADNCRLLEDGTCLKEPPAFTWRDYSMVLYLNNDFDGGDFVFANNSDLASEQSRVTPKCGLGLGFSSGGENLHGVTAVTSGKRCAIGLWFTYDKNSREMERMLADIILKRIKSSGSHDVNDLTVSLLTKYSGFSSAVAEEQLKKFRSLDD